MEHNIQFTVIRKNETKSLKGLVFTDKEEEVTATDLQKMFKQFGYDVELDENDWSGVVFVSKNTSEPYKIRITDMGDGKHKPDTDNELKSIVANFIKPH